MSASRTEQIVARVAAVLAVLPGVAVSRYTGQRLSAAELPALVVRRGGTQNQSASFENMQSTVGIDLDIFTVAGAGTEPAADAIHMAAHALLVADATLAAQGSNTLQCVSTESVTDELDAEYTQLTTHYQLDTWILQADLTTAA